VTRIVTLAVALVLLAAAPAGAATTLVLPDGTKRPQPYQSWVDGAKVPTPDGEVTLRLDGCGEDMPACAPVGERTISLSPDWSSRHVLLHELGHVFDDGMPEWVRARFSELVELRGAWLAEAAAAPAGERFAEQRLAAAFVSVDVHGVEQRDAGIERGIDDRALPLQVDDPAEVVATEADDRDFRPVLA